MTLSYDRRVSATDEPLPKIDGKGVIHSQAQYRSPPFRSFTKDTEEIFRPLEMVFPSVFSWMKKWYYHFG